LHCANPNCHTIAEDILKGTLTLVEFEAAPADRLLYAEGGFPVCCARTRYFWLCEPCSEHLAIKKWNSAGPILVPLQESSSYLSELNASKIPVSKVRPAIPNRSEDLFGIA
jgi:hypothetical protein